MGQIFACPSPRPSLPAETNLQPGSDHCVPHNRGPRPATTACPDSHAGPQHHIATWLLGQCHCTLLGGAGTCQAQQQTGLPAANHWPWGPAPAGLRPAIAAFLDPAAGVQHGITTCLPVPHCTPVLGAAHIYLGLPALGLSCGSPASHRGSHTGVLPDGTCHLLGLKLAPERDHGPCGAVR